MRAGALLLAAALLCPLASGSAHRLDKYLQAATIELAPGTIIVALRLTPGVSVARQIVADIDADGDGVLSANELHRYAERVRQNLSLAVDGHPDPLRLVASAAPDVGALMAGTGDIDLRFEANLPAAGGGHRLGFENHHLPSLGIYLVNTVLPRDSTIWIISQERSYDQSSYQLGFEAGAMPQGSGAAPQHPAWMDRLAVVRSFFWQGVHHILTGYDHLLFVVALVLGAATLWDLVKVVTAFTAAHSLTLTLAALGAVHLPDAVVEPLISASIVFVAVQNILSPERSHGRSRLAVAFCFGLFHGLGFAGGLLEMMHQMPASTILTAILGFSMGIEAGNQLVLLPLFGALTMFRPSKRESAQGRCCATTVQQISSAAIAIAGSYYLLVALGSRI